MKKNTAKNNKSNEIKYFREENYGNWFFYQPKHVEEVEEIEEEIEELDEEIEEIEEIDEVICTDEDDSPKSKIEKQEEEELLNKWMEKLKTLDIEEEYNF